MKSFNLQPKLAAGIVAVCGDKFLVGLRSLTQSEHNTWTYPGGKYESKLDKNLKETAIREFLEETGIPISIDEIAPLCCYTDPLNKFVFQTYFTKLETRPPIISDKEHIRFEWNRVKDFRSNLYTKHYGLTFALPYIEKLIYPSKQELAPEVGYDSIYTNNKNKYYGVSI